MMAKNIIYKFNISVVYITLTMLTNYDDCVLRVLKQSLKPGIIKHELKCHVVIPKKLCT